MNILGYAFFLLALNIYHEGRGEPLAGQIMICHTVLNRADDDYGKIEEVIFSPYQFSWTADRNKYVKDYAAFMDCKKAVVKCLQQRKRGYTGLGVTHYHGVDITPEWASNLEPVVMIGKHIFYTGD